MQECDAVLVCRIAWTEAYAVLSRRVREMPEDALLIEMAKVALASDWPKFVVLDIVQRLIELAGEYADTFALRGYDSIQLVAAFEISRISQAKLFFACYDLRLNKAAKFLGMLSL